MRKHRSIAVLIASVTALLFLVTACAAPAAVPPSAPVQTAPAPAGQEKSAPEADLSPLKIGFGLALTGGSAEQGQANRRGAILAIEEINEAGGIDGRMLEAVFMDDKNDPKEAANVANLLVSDPDILAVLGHCGSSSTLAAAPIYEEAGLVVCSVNSSSPLLTEAGNYVYRIWNSDTYNAAFHARGIIERGFTQAAIIYENDDYGIGGYKVSSKVLEEAGINIALAESYLLGETKDYSTIITKLKTANVEGVFMIGDETELATFCKQARQQDYFPFITSQGTYNYAVIELGGSDVEGLYGATFFDPANPPARVAEIYARYKERFASENALNPRANSICAYDFIQILANAFRAGHTTRDGVKEYLDTMGPYDGAVGTFEFDENGDVMLPMIRLVVKGGDFVEAS